MKKLFWFCMFILHGCLHIVDYIPSHARHVCTLKAHRFTHIICVLYDKSLGQMSRMYVQYCTALCKFFRCTLSLVIRHIHSEINFV